MMKPLISIIVPVYNGEKTLGRCLDSVLQQSFQDFEVIVVDDGSRDGSSRLCDNYSRKDPRIHVIHQENAGVSAARNVGIREAQGEYITFLDSDDYWLSSHLEQYYHAAQKFNCDVVVGGFTIIDHEQTRVCQPQKAGCFGVELWEDISRDSTIYGYLWNKLFRGELIRTGGFLLCEEMYSQEDLDFCLSVFGEVESVVQISCDTYQYNYALGKRSPPFWDFIANQLKMLRIGEMRTNLSNQTKSCVHQRIISLLYTGLYHAADRSDYNETVEKFARVAGLTELLKTVSVKGERAFVVRHFVAGRYGKIRLYFRVRNTIRDIVRLIRKK